MIVSLITSRGIGSFVRSYILALVWTVESLTAWSSGNVRILPHRNSRTSHTIIEWVIIKIGEYALGLISKAVSVMVWLLLFEKKSEKHTTLFISTALLLVSLEFSVFYSISDYCSSLLEPLWYILLSHMFPLIEQRGKEKEEKLHLL